MASAPQPINARPRSNSDFLTLTPVQSASSTAPPASDDSARSSLSSSLELTSGDGGADGLAAMLEKNKLAAATGGRAATTMRFLRLGPVHYGSVGVSDFAEE
ncbi:MAG: hypothetical protein M1821_001323 [Bathelium mastoideum]|nr:MAG: hypothetical protein M1821_001323 [Bathelium mastoideum]KAI9689848.1 MAG: hypothetical protein M1822_009730 [Bathelium mastoideum]